MVQRSEVSRQAILDATLELLDFGGSNGLTVQRLTIESIARRAGVSKATIYRWWPSKAAVVLDAFVSDYVDHTRIPEGLPVTETLRLHMRSVVQRFAGPEGRLVAQIIAEAQYDDAALNEFRERFWSGRHRAIEELITRGIDAGEITASISPSIAGSLLYSPIYERLLLGSGPLDDEFADRIFESAFGGLSHRD